MAKPGLFGRVGWFGGASFIFIAIYLLAIRVVFLYEQRQANTGAIEQSNTLSLTQVALRFCSYAIIVMLVSALCPFLANAWLG